MLKGYCGGATGVVPLGERFGSGVLGWGEQVGQAYPGVELAADFVPEVVDAFRAVLCGIDVDAEMTMVLGMAVPFGKARAGSQAGEHRPACSAPGQARPPLT